MLLNQLAKLLVLAALVYGATRLGLEDFRATAAVSRLIEGHR